MICNQCGAENAETRRFCTSCGAPLSERAQSIEQAAQNAANTAVPSAAPLGDTLGKVLESAKTAAGSVQSAAKEVNVRAVSQAGQSLLTQAGGLWKKLRAQRIFRTVVTAVLALAVLSVSVAGGYSLVGRDVTQTVMGEEKYAQMMLTNALEKSLFSAMDAIKDMPAGDKADTVRATVSLDAGIPDSYLDDLLDELPYYSQPDNDEYELLRLLCASSLEASYLMDTSSKKPLLSLSGGWKVDGKSILDADLKAQGGALYVSIPQLLGDTFGVDLSSLGVDLTDLNPGSLYAELLSELLYGGYYYSPYMDEAEVEAMVAALGDYMPKLKPILSSAIEAAIAQLDMSLVNNEIVDINDKTAKLDRVTLTLTETDMIRAMIAALESVLDSDKAVSTLADITKTLAPLDVDPMTAKAMRTQLEAAIEDLEYDLGYADSTEALEFSLYIDSGNKVCGLSFDVEDGDTFVFVAKRGTGFEMSYGKDFRLYGDLNGLTGYKGNVNIYIRNGRDVLEGKICDFTFSGGLTQFSASVTLTVSDIMDLMDSAGMEGEIPQLFENATMTYKLSAGSGGASVGVTLSDSGRKASLSAQMSVELGKSVNVKVNESAKVYSAYELEYRLDMDEMYDNMEKIVEKLEKMGYDVTFILDEMFY